MNDYNLLAKYIVDKYVSSVSGKDLKDRIIYQLMNMDQQEYSATKDIFLFEMLVWYEDNLCEVVKVEAMNVIARQYEDGKLISEIDFVKGI